MAKSDRHHWPVFIAEVTTTAVLGLILLVINAKDLAQLTWIIGFFLIFARYSFARSVKEDIAALREHVDSELAIVKGLANVVDTSTTARTDTLRQINDLYFRVTESEFSRVKDQVIEEVRIELDRLAHQRRSGTLVTGEYYNWLLPIIRATEPGSEIWAVSMMLECEWDDSPEEVEFLQLNLDALNRGVRLTRVFVVPQDKYDDLVKLEPVQRQVVAEGPGNIRYVFRDRLQRLDPQILKRLGDGLIAFDDRVALIDEHSQDGTARGYVTMNPPEIARWRNDFENLLAYSAKIERPASALPPGSDQKIEP